MSRSIRALGFIWALCIYVTYLLYVDLTGGTFFEAMLASMVFGIAIILFGQDNDN